MHPDDILRYALANIAYAVAPLQAEIERLHAEIERLAMALRLAEEHINALTPEWYSAGQRVLTEIRAALPAGDGAQKGVVAWARPVYARPVSAPDTGKWDELVDIEFHNRPEKPEGEGWYPLVVANTGDGTPLPRINVKCETVDNGIAGSVFLKVIRVEQEDDGSLTVVIDHWPQQEASEQQVNKDE
jgi:hypothetical protein